MINVGDISETVEGLNSLPVDTIITDGERTGALNKIPRAWIKTAPLVWQYFPYGKLDPNEGQIDTPTQRHVAENLTRWHVHRLGAYVIAEEPEIEDVT